MNYRDHNTCTYSEIISTWHRTPRDMFSLHMVYAVDVTCNKHNDDNQRFYNITLDVITININIPFRQL